MMNVCTEQTARLLLQWYDRSKRELPWRMNHDPYRVWVSEIMLQQTRVEAVIPYYERFLRRFPDVFALAEAPEEDAVKAWEGLGYYSRVRNMQKAARIIAASGGIFPQNADELRKLPGFGEYTAGAVASIAFNQPVPAVDGNVLRVLSRLNCDDRDISEPQTRKSAALQIGQWIPDGRAGDFNQAIMDLGATVCLPTGEPRCGECPLQQHCLAFAKGCQRSYPVKAPKPERRQEKKTVFVLLHGDLAAIRRRPAGDVLAGMWELPTVSGWLSEQEQREQLSGWGVRLQNNALQQLPAAKHVFTHIEWQMKGVLIQAAEPAGTKGLRWITPEERSGEIAIPSAFRAYLRYLP
ncbi:MAG: A/G-specific adenine glycosylase [Firmicutes bacterium]|nr:A/G-specific adenine glycosylase [Bacillota bacterium]